MESPERWPFIYAIYLWATGLYFVWWSWAAWITVQLGLKTNNGRYHTVSVSVSLLQHYSYWQGRITRTEIRPRWHMMKWVSSVYQIYKEVLLLFQWQGCGRASRTLWNLDSWESTTYKVKMVLTCSDLTNVNVVQFRQPAMDLRYDFVNYDLYQTWTNAVTLS